MARTKFNVEVSASSEMRMKYGYLQENNPQIVYLTGKSWISPQNIEDCSKKVNKIQRRFDRYITNRLEKNVNFTEKKILDFYLPTNAFIKGKKKFFQFDCILKQREKHTIEELKPIMFEFGRDLSAFLANEFRENDFTPSKNK